MVLVASRCFPCAFPLLHFAIFAPVPLVPFVVVCVRMRACIYYIHICIYIYILNLYVEFEGMGSSLDPLVNHPGRGLRAHSAETNLTWRLSKTSPAPRSDGNPMPTPNSPYQPQGMYVYICLASAVPGDVAGAPSNLLKFSGIWNISDDFKEVFWNLRKILEFQKSLGI